MDDDDLVKPPANSTFAAAVIGIAAGFAAWHFGLGDAIWPSNPEICALVITVLVGIAVKLWPRKPQA